MRFLRIKPLLLVVVAAVFATAVVTLTHSSVVTEQPASAQTSHSGQLAVPATSGLASIQAARQALLNAVRPKAGAARRRRLSFDQISVKHAP